MYKQCFLGSFLLSLALGPALGQSAPAWLPDSQGRHFIPHGFVTITGDATGEVRYTAEDYRRMSLLGANFQVIRIFLGKLGGWPGYQLDAKYLDQLDEMVALGKQAGMQTAFKLTVYDVGKPMEGFTWEDWRDLYLDKDHRQSLLVGAWRQVFQRYKDEASVFGYDLVNEPCATRARQPLWEAEPRFKDCDAFHRDYFVPLYRKLIDELHRISGTRKWAFFQPYHVPPPMHIKSGFPCLPLKVSLDRGGIVFAPHYYGQDPVLAVERYAADAAVSQAPMLFGEYGAPTFADTDRVPAVQAAYQRLLIETVAEFDRRALGCVKAWWCGSRDFNRALKNNPKARTWAVLCGDSPAGGAERKYITDVIARPRPLVVAGLVNGFHFDFEKSVFEMRFVPDSSKGQSEFFIPVDRHFPDGFRIGYGQSEVDFPRGTPDGFEARTPGGAVFRWDAKRMRLLVVRWDARGGETTLRVAPSRRAVPGPR